MPNLSQIFRIRGPPRGFVNISANWLMKTRSNSMNSDDGLWKAEGGRWSGSVCCRVGAMKASMWAEMTQIEVNSMQVGSKDGKVKARVVQMLIRVEYRLISYWLDFGSKMKLIQLAHDGFMLSFPSRMKVRPRFVVELHFRREGEASSWVFVELLSGQRWFSVEKEKKNNEEET